MSFSNNRKSAQYSQENRDDRPDGKEHQFKPRVVNDMDTGHKHSKRNSQFNRFQSIFYIPPQLQLLTQKAQQKLLSKPNPESSMSTSRRESIQNVAQKDCRSILTCLKSLKKQVRSYNFLLNLSLILLLTFLLIRLLFKPLLYRHLILKSLHLVHPNLIPYLQPTQTRPTNQPPF